jgi:hypothetical protein
LLLSDDLKCEVAIMDAMLLVTACGQNPQATGPVALANSKQCMEFNPSADLQTFGEVIAGPWG